MPEQNDKTTVIIGAGAVGLALGSCLHAAGRSVHFVLRDSPAPHTIERFGIRRTGLLGEQRVPASALGVSRSIADLDGLAMDSILVCTKSTANEDIVPALAALWPKLSENVQLVVCQNGWGNLDAFAAALDPERVACASILTGFRRNEEYRVEITVHARSIQIGYLHSTDHRALEPLCQAIDQGGIPCETSETIGADLAAKLLYNCLLNPLGALARVPYGKLAEEDSARKIMEATAREIFEVLTAAGIATHWPNAESYLASFYRDLLPPTAEHESSMLQDLEAGRRTEIDALCGAVVKLGRPLGVATPVNIALRDLIRAAERR
ncbi:MAG: 2-dehydropantoate 2-reductase [Myxococcota bacterium]|jgi:2-dehydropantoate 2-reductase|nr:2-dehydropantoate 2-reductase [Myxococcota bacterium]